MTNPSTKAGILLNEEFVTKSVLDARLQNAREEIETLSNVRFAKSLTCLCKIARKSLSTLGGRNSVAAIEVTYRKKDVVKKD